MPEKQNEWLEIPKNSIQSYLWNIVYTALKGSLKLGSGGAYFNPSTWDVENGGSQFVRGQPGLQRACHNKTKPKKKKKKERKENPSQKNKKQTNKQKAVYGFPCVAVHFRNNQHFKRVLSELTVLHGQPKASVFLEEEEAGNVAH